MLTPRFSCSQTETSVIVSMYCPSIRASEVEINVDEHIFTVHVNPYFLRLNFPHPVIEDDDSAAKYDPSSGYLTVTLTKEQRGQHFNDLDLLAKLLAPPPVERNDIGPSIEVLESEDSTEADSVAQELEELSLDEERRQILEAAENDWRLPQNPEPHLSTSVQKYYGFLGLHSGYFNSANGSANEVNELGVDAETCTPPERRRRRIEHENQKWNEDHYMADYGDDEYIQELLHWKHPHTLIDTTSFTYSETENAAMLRLPRKEYIFTSTQANSLYLTLITILFSYVYDARVTQHDPTPESAWTIASLTPAFSALDPPPYPLLLDEKLSASDGSFSTEDVLAGTIAASYRRALAFPLFRSWVLADRCREDVAAILQKGTRVVVRCLLEVKDILDHHDAYYVYAKIWVNDLLVWLMTHTSQEALMQLGEKVAALKMQKRWMAWDLEELEASVQAALNEQREPDSDDETDVE